MTYPMDEELPEPIQSGRTENLITAADWNRRDEIWYIVGLHAGYLYADVFGAPAPEGVRYRDMDTSFLNRHEVEQSRDFAIRWEDFEQAFHDVIPYLDREEILRALLAFSKDETSLRSTRSIKKEIRRRLGVELRCLDGPSLPGFCFDGAMTVEDFFFEEFISTKRVWYVADPIRFAAWVLRDRRWAVLTTVDSI